MIGQEQSLGEQLESYVLPAPTLGWNRRDALPVMDERYALEIENFIADTDAVKKRAGSSNWATGAGDSNVQNMATIADSYLIISGLVAPTTYKTYRVSASGGAVTDITGAATPTGPFLVMHEFRDRLFMCNITPALPNPSAGGVDIYTAQTAGNIAVAGFTVGGSAIGNWIAIGSYRSRLYAATVDTIYYAAADAITGAMTAFPIRSVIKHGGVPIFIGSLTRSKEVEEDDLFCIVTNNGEVILYEGEDPGDANWRKIGHYIMPRPISHRAWFRAGHDLFFNTVGGVVPIRNLMSGLTIVDEGFFTTELITPAYQDLQSDFLTYITYHYYRSGAVFYSKKGIAILSLSSGSDPDEYLDQIAIRTKGVPAISLFTGMNAFCWAVFQNQLLFGTAGGLIQLADDATAEGDEIGSSGVFTDIACKVRQANTYLGDPIHKKRIHFLKPTVKMTGGLELVMGVNMDFEDVTATDVVTDSAVLTEKIYQPMIKVSGIGQAASIRMDQAYEDQTLEWISTNIYYESGSIK